jgi:PspAB-like protein
MSCRDATLVEKRAGALVGLGDILFGKKRLKGANLDKLFALSTAEVTLKTELGLRSAGVAAVVFKPLSASEFSRAEQEIDELLGVAAQSSGSEVRRRSDSLGFNWLVIRDPDFEDLVTSVHLVSSELQARGFGGQLLAALFPFEGAEKPVNLIYGFKNGTFWPFVPSGADQERDNAQEMRLKNELEKELPIEPDLTRWLALFNAPLDT